MLRKLVAFDNRIGCICTHRRANGYKITRYGEVHRNRASRRSEYV
jgi:hypothetical protein